MSGFIKVQIFFFKMTNIFKITIELIITLFRITLEENNFIAKPSFNEAFVCSDLTAIVMHEM